MRKEAKLIQSYVRDRYFVSTILRESSAMGDPTKYFETLTWEVDERGKRGKLINQEDSSTSPYVAFDRHLKTCVLLAEKHDPPSLEISEDFI